MIKFLSDSEIDYEHTSFKDLREFFAGQILQALVTGGGEGMNMELRSLMECTLAWKEARDKMKLNNSTIPPRS